MEGTTVIATNDARGILRKKPYLRFVIPDLIVQAKPHHSPKLSAASFFHTDIRTSPKAPAQLVHELQENFDFKHPHQQRSPVEHSRHDSICASMWKAVQLLRLEKSCCRRIFAHGLYSSTVSNFVKCFLGMLQTSKFVMQLTTCYANAHVLARI
jgi:hypothetical protein